LIAKLIAWGRDREEAINRMQRALYEYAIIGVKTNIPFHQAVMANQRFARGELGTHFLEQETSLIEDIKKFAEQEESLGEKLAGLGVDKKKVAAIAAVAALINT
jgi:pyruvate carboxylase subunit A